MREACRRQKIEEAEAGRVGGGRECLIIKTRRITLRKKEDTIMKLSTFLYH